MANQQHGSGNFSDDPKKASDAGHKGGQHSQQGSSDKSGSHSGQQEQSHRSSGQHGAQDASSGQQGGRGSNFKDDPEKAREAGRKGGEHSHGGK